MRTRCGDTIPKSLLCGLICINAANAQFLENELEFNVPIDSHRVLSGYNGERGSILLTGRSKTSEKFIGLYPISQDSVDTAAMLEISVPADVLFFDAGGVANEPNLLFLTPDGISRLDAESATLQQIMWPFPHRSKVAFFFYFPTNSFSSTSSRKL